MDVDALNADSSNPATPLYNPGIPLNAARATQVTIQDSPFNPYGLSVAVDNTGAPVAAFYYPYGVSATYNDVFQDWIGVYNTNTKNFSALANLGWKLTVDNSKTNGPAALDPGHTPASPITIGDTAALQIGNAINLIGSANAVKMTRTK